MNRLPYIELEYVGDAIDGIYITSSTPDASQNALLESAEDLAARDRLFIASTYVSDFLIYRSLHPEEGALQTVEAVVQATNNAFSYLKGSGVSADDCVRYMHGGDDDPRYVSREFDSWSIAAFEHTDVTRLRACVESATLDTRKMTHFLPMANSALPIALHAWNSISADRRMALHPILFSRAKMEHSIPQISEEELEYFKFCTDRGDNFIVFEEDTQSGDTVLNMMNFLVRYTGADFKQVCGITPSYSRTGQHAVLRRGVEGLEATLF